ncbi:MAG: hypothetical protein M1820_004212 [Bogoriella megaspora]|nr:MAG: hypothetical protein M1820_004212 [Bogoriella megaspora]
MTDYDAYLAESHVPTIIGVNVMFLALSIIAVAARFYARRMTGAGFWWDDWACLITMPFTLALNTWSVYYAAGDGLGRHSEVAPGGGKFYLQHLYAGLVEYNIGIAGFKIVDLLLYVRIWNKVRWVKTAAIVLSTMIIAWLISVTFVNIFQCTPIHKAWDMTLPYGHCIDQVKLFLAQSIPTIVFDLCVLIIPIPLVWMIQLPSSTRWSLIGMFMLSGFVTVISIVRLSTLFSTDFTSDITWRYTTLAIWSDAEPPVGLISCCVPAYGPYIRGIKRIITGSSGDDSAGSNHGLHAMSPSDGRSRTPDPKLGEIIRSVSYDVESHSTAGLKDNVVGHSIELNRL